MSRMRKDEYEEVGETLGKLALEFKKYTPQQKCITVAAIFFISALPYYFIYHSLTRTPTNLRLTNSL